MTNSELRTVNLDEKNMDNSTHNNTNDNNINNYHQEKNKKMYNEIRKMLDASYNSGGDMLSTFSSKLITKYGYDSFENSRICESDKNEPILDPKNSKFTAFPIVHNNIWKMYKDQMACFWTAEEIDLSTDYKDFLTLNEDEQHFIKMILAFFAQSDGIVNFNLGERFTREIQITEAQFAYTYQMMMENIHGEVYSLMLDNIVKDPEEKKKLFNAIETIPSIKTMADWAFKWIDSSDSFAHRVVAFAIVEGIFFSGAFAAIYWLRKYKNTRNMSSTGKSFMYGLTSSNDLIARDEGLHTRFACELYKLVENKLSQNEIYKIMAPAVKIAQEFMIESIPVRLIGMNNKSMCDYISYVSDRLLNMLGYKKLYHVKNPFKFMDTIALTKKKNFFEVTPVEYQNSNINDKKRKNGNKKLLINNDF